ncbi:hypothetical protein HJC23_003488 [Cyclotella cryptica]|uniref:Prolyl 4-hydroxylase alpha subunit Fe(2+) 2OG dioxygenase domain-containing protein n=1 Tax=Cyclotella cryptica TaxID=29204 RepID=A0ABD3QSC2_9STRA
MICAVILHFRVFLFTTIAPLCNAFTPSSLAALQAPLSAQHLYSRRIKKCRFTRQRSLYGQVPFQEELSDSFFDASLINSEQVRLSVSTSVGIEPDTELPCVLNAISSVCEEFGIPFEHGNIRTDPLPFHPEAIPGVLGRVLLIHVDGVPDTIVADDTDLISQIKIYASEQIDGILAGGEEQRQPILLAFRNRNSEDSLENVIAKEISDYGLRDAIESSKHGSETSRRQSDDSKFLPSKHFEIDGAFVQSSIDSPADTHFDTSSIIVFDNLVDPSLRKRLLNVVKGNPEEAPDESNESEFGPDPNRWERGGLIDVVDEDGTERTSNGTCWGLTDDAIVDICFSHHPAIAEFETTLSHLFSDFVVSRLPEAVFGDCISPLTANAPTHGDTFENHIDADPLQVPPSPWADVFGRYPNRSSGKPRFVSCLLYLNECWDSDWGAPTRFLDPPTQQTIDVIPKPGRCVIMDQDISHTVVAPNVEAGKRPRYSLVWKLILHPKTLKQDMKDLYCGRKQVWPDPTIVGSARVS